MTNAQLNYAYPSGAVWRKWDLHVHTPASVLNNGFGSDWDTYVQCLFRALIEQEIAVVGITDYFTVDGYKKLKTDYLDNAVKLAEIFAAEEIAKIQKILVIPNIEFRSDIFVGQNSINFHVLFSEVVPIKDIEEKFLHEINFTYQGEPQSEDRHRKLKEGNLIELGTQLKSEHAHFTESPLRTGMMNAVVDHKQVSKILFEKEAIFGGKYMFVVVADEDLSAIGWNSRDHLTRKVLIQKSDLLFSSNPKTRKWALGQPPYGEGVEKFISEFKTLKPCIHGSDAHESRFIAHPCARRGKATHDCVVNADQCDLRFCWIKADPTFEGFRQVLYEPEDRITIQSADPTPLKTSQSIAEFSIKSATLEPELTFKDERIPFNEGLVAVTGGKGSGKTALVEPIANIYENRVSCNDRNSFVKRICESETPGDLETIIKLQDGREHTKEIKDGTLIEGASIVYVAQGELEKHVADPAHLESYINTLIFESNGVKDSELLFDYGNINDEVSAINESIKASNRLIFTLENETEPKLEEDLSKEGKKLATDLKDTGKKIADFAKSLSPEKIKEAEAKQKLLTDLREAKANFTELGIKIKETLQFVDENLVAFNKEIGTINLLAAKLGFQNQFKSVVYPDAEDLRLFIGTVRDELRKTIGKIEKFQKDLEENEKGIKEHAKLLDKRKEIEKAIQKTIDKAEVIKAKKKTLAEEVEKRESLFESLLNKRVEQRNKYLAIIGTFAANKNDILNDLEFTAELAFDRSRFVETMSELVDQRKINIGGVTDDDSDIAFFTGAMSDLMVNPSVEKVKVIACDRGRALLEKIVPNQKRAETISRRTIYDSVFGDYLSILPSVKYKKVKLSKLSLGQKATVLIKIYLAQGENPIIIDSHDDHLDNEFIMDELVKALRQAKQHRQVIVVSNNGNVVVNSDAEQVVIACRNDQGEISYSSGSLENPTLRPKLLRVLEGGEEAFSKRQQKYRLGG